MWGVDREVAYRGLWVERLHIMSVHEEWRIYGGLASLWLSALTEVSVIWPCPMPWGKLSGEGLLGGLVFHYKLFCLWGFTIIYIQGVSGLWGRPTGARCLHWMIFTIYFVGRLPEISCNLIGIVRSIYIN
jgi:hypothetical protein